MELVVSGLVVGDASVWPDVVVAVVVVPFGVLVGVVDPALGFLSALIVLVLLEVLYSFVG